MLEIHNNSWITLEHLLCLSKPQYFGLASEAFKAALFNQCVLTPTVAHLAFCYLILVTSDAAIHIQLFPLVLTFFYWLRIFHLYQPSPQFNMWRELLPHSLTTFCLFVVPSICVKLDLRQTSVSFFLCHPKILFVGYHARSLAIVYIHTSHF